MRQAGKTSGANGVFRIDIKMAGIKTLVENTGP